MKFWWLIEYRYSPTEGPYYVAGMHEDGKPVRVTDDANKALKFASFDDACTYLNTQMGNKDGCAIREHGFIDEATGL